jgi:hypothetical protein
MPNNILSNREYICEHGWYAPREKLLSFPSVTHAELTDTTSSSGDWSGFFVQAIGKDTYMLPFSQENRAWNGRGYTLYTGKPMYKWPSSLEHTNDELIQLYVDWMKAAGYL